MKNYYEILGVQKSATKDDIKKAFRKLAHQYHPDKKDGNADKFKDVSEAYSVLSDDSKRQQYDRFGTTAGAGFNPGTGGFGGQAGQGFGGGSGFEGFDFSEFARQAGASGMGGANGQGFEFDLGDIFSDFFGGGTSGAGNSGGMSGLRRERTERGRDISIDLELSFEESIFGVERRVLLTKTSICDHCKGTGGEPGSEMKTCPTCNGKGKIHETRRSLLGSFTTVATCATCRGNGKVAKDKCKVCRGNGVMTKQEEISIQIPAGISDGEMIRMAGQGEAIAGGTAGDLYIKIHVKSHAYFVKDGSNLITNLNVKFTTALLGGEQVLNTLDGNITITIPEGITHGQILRVKSKGVPIDKNRRGDLLVRLNIQIPKKLSREEKRLIEELKKAGL
jgi:molecular chaperone DnaJ